MTLDPHARRLLDMMALGRSVEPSVADRRAGLANLARLGGMRERRPARAASRDLAAAGAAGPLAARLYTPLEPGPGPLPGLVFFHGGGLTTGDLDTHDGLCRALTEAGGLAVLAVAYRLAPEHPFPAAAEDACAATAWAWDAAPRLGLDPARLAVGGDSAGAGLAAHVAQARRGRPGPPLAAQLLLCPVLDPFGRHPSRHDFAEGHLLDAATIARDLAAAGLDDRHRDDPRIAPLQAPDLAGLPPAVIHTAAFDPVRDEGEAYAARLRAAGVPVRLTRHAGQIHFFYGLGGLIPAGAPALAGMGAELADLLGGAARPATGMVACPA